METLVTVSLLWRACPGTWIRVVSRFRAVVMTLIGGTASTSSPHLACLRLVYFSNAESTVSSVCGEKFP